MITKVYVSQCLVIFLLSLVADEERAFSAERCLNLGNFEWEDDMRNTSVSGDNLYARLEVYSSGNRPIQVVLVIKKGEIMDHLEISKFHAF